MIRAFLLHSEHSLEMELVGHPTGSMIPNRSLLTVVMNALAGQKNGRRIWHARRNNELIAGIAMKLFLGLPIKVVFTAASARERSALTNWLLGHVDAIIATSPEAARAIRRTCHVIPHGVDTRTFYPAVDRDAAWLSRGVGGRYGIGVFGRVRPQKGTDLFVDVMIRLLPRYPTFRAVIVGLTQRKHFAFKDELEKRIEAAGLADRIVFLGERPADEVPSWLACVSIAVAPQRNEGFGLVPLEAAASGTAVVATRTGAAASVVKHGKTGLLIPPNDIDSLEKAIECLMIDAELRGAMGRAARQHAVDALDLAQEVDANINVYRRLLSA